MAPPRIVNTLFMDELQDHIADLPRTMGSPKQAIAVLRSVYSGTFDDLNWLLNTTDIMKLLVKYQDSTRRSHLAVFIATLGIFKSPKYKKAKAFYTKQFNKLTKDLEF